VSPRRATTQPLHLYLHGSLLPDGVSSPGLTLTHALRRVVPGAAQHGEYVVDAVDAALTAACSLKLCLPRKEVGVR
jgi:hypothetical protein